MGWCTISGSTPAAGPDDPGPVPSRPVEKEPAIHVLSIPAGHPYTQRIRPDGVTFSPDPDIDGTWWPHPALEADWWRVPGQGAGVDLVHVHFGFEHRSPAQIRELVEALAERAVPLVVTVHDLDNPHLENQGDHHERLRILCAAAAAVITLTEEARTRLLALLDVPPGRLGVRVIPHPRIVPADAVVRDTAVHDADGGAGRPVAGVFLKSLRSNVIADPAFYQELEQHLQDLAGAAGEPAPELRIHAHDVPAVAELAHALPQLRLHPPLEDEELFEAVGACTCVLLPYLRGTHSGWLEMCRDLGVTVVAPEVGAYASQADDPRAVRTVPAGDPSAAAAALFALARQGRLPYRGERSVQEESIRAEHAAVYRDVLQERPLRIALVAPARHPIREPYAGGLESFCHSLMGALRERGHRVDLYAAAGSDGHVQDCELPSVQWGDHVGRANDADYPPGGRERETAGFERLVEHLTGKDYDVVHNNSLHPALFRADGRLPLVTTLHTPALPEVQEAIGRAGDAAGAFVAVSRATAEAWDLPRPVTIIPNGVDTELWALGPGGPSAVWFGRIVPEKGLHLAIDAARQAGLPLRIAGRIGDPQYYAEEIAPRLAADPSLIHVGELSHAALARLVGEARVCLVTPRWDEPFGLVAIEAMSCGTPVAALARGGLEEVLEGSPAILVDSEDPEELAAAARELASPDDQPTAQQRAAIREWVRTHHSLEATADRYEQLYRALAAQGRAEPSEQGAP